MVNTFYLYRMYFEALPDNGLVYSELSIQLLSKVSIKSMHILLY